MDYLKLKELRHSGIKGMRWGERRFQNEDGSLTPEGILRYGLRGKRSVIDKARDVYQDRKHLVRASDWEEVNERYKNMSNMSDKANRDLTKANRDLENVKKNLHGRAKRIAIKTAKKEISTALERKQMYDAEKFTAEQDIDKMRKDPNYSPTLARQKATIKKIVNTTGKLTLGALGGLDSMVEAKGLSKNNYPKGLNGMVYKIRDVFGSDAKGNMHTEKTSKGDRAADALTSMMSLVTGAIAGNSDYNTLSDFVLDKKKQSVNHGDYSKYIITNDAECIHISVSPSDELEHGVPEGKTLITGPKGGTYYESSSGSKVYVNNSTMGSNTNNRTTNNTVHGNVAKTTEKKGNQDNKQTNDQNQHITINKYLDGKSFEKASQDNPGKQENQNGKRNANNAKPDGKSQPGPNALDPNMAKLKSIYQNQSKNYETGSRTMQNISSGINNISNTMPIKRGSKEYGTYDGYTTQQLKTMIDRIQTERNYSDLIGDTRYIKSGSEKLHEILGIAGGVAATVATGLGILANIKSMKANKIV